MTPELWAEIRRLAGVEKISGRAISRMLRVSPRTVRRALRADTFTAPVRPPRGSIVDPFMPKIEDILARHPDLSAVRILEELRPCGYQGRITALKRRLREIRVRPKEAFLPLRFEPGEAAQVDWASCGALRIGDAERRLSCFVMVLCHSRLLYLEFTVSEGLAEFMRCHVNAFNFFQCVPRRLIYDNLRSVVLSRSGSEIRFQPRFLNLAGHYLFKPDACRPRRPNEKGRVENAVRYIRESFLAGRDLRSLAEYELAARRWRDEVANVRLHATTRRKPADLFTEEKAYLLPLPPAPFDADALETRLVSTTALVSFDGNRYSVPAPLVGETVTVRASSAKIVILHASGEVAVHARSYDRGKDIEIAEHRREIVEAKRRAEESLETRRFLGLGPEAERYFRGLGQTEHDAPRQVRRVLALVDTYGEIEVLGAIAKALEFRAFGADYIERIVSQERRRRAAPEPLGPVHVSAPHFADVAFPPANLADYDRVLTGPKTRDKEPSDHVSNHAGTPEPGEESDRASS